MNRQQTDAEAASRSSNREREKENSRKGRNLNLTQRRELTLRRAAPLFLEKGYDSVSMNDIIDVTGGSKATIYALFGNKEGLFEEVVRWIASETSVSVDVAQTAGPVGEQLRTIGKTFLESILHPQIIELHRLMVSMGRTFPAATSGFYQAGPANAYRLVAEWIAERQNAGEIGKGDADELAALFLDMLLGEYQLSILTGTMQHATTGQIERRVDVAVDIFLGGCAAT